VIHEISLAECLEPCAPPDRVLRVSALDDVAFVRISEVKQDSHSETHTETAEISVSLPSLLEALALLAADVERENLRPLDRDGKSRETRLAGTRFTAASAGPGSVVAAATRHQRYTPPPGVPVADVAEEARP
jgi:hypothetical protein